MRKQVVLFLLAISFLGATAYAGKLPCGRNIETKSNQRRQADGSAFIPGKNTKGQDTSVATVRARN